MNNYRIITLRERPELVAIAAEWFHSKWGVPAEAYLECMKAYLSGKTEYGWYICLYDESIVAGLGVIENDFFRRGPDVPVSEEQDMPDGFLIFLRTYIVLLPFPG